MYFHSCSLHHLPVSLINAMFGGLYRRSGVSIANQILDAGIPAGLTPWPLPGNWDCCFVFQSMERSCRGLHEEEARRNYH